MAKKTVIKINTNITTGEHFNGDGASFRSSEPQVSYRSNFLVAWQLFTETPNADESGVNLSLWTPADFSGCGAIVTCDNDFRHRIAGTLATAINTGETVSSVTIKTSAASADVPESGMISLYSDSGSVKDIEYSGMTITANGYILQLSEEFNADANYPAGSSANISQEPLFQAMYIPEESDPVKGLFVFDCYAYSKRLAALADTSAGRNITVQGLEILPFATDDNSVIRELPAYLIDTFTLNVNLAEVGAVIPEYTGEPSELLAALASLVVHGLDIQVHNKESGWHDYTAADLEDAEYARSLTAYRIRLSGSTGDWSLPVPLIHGGDGKKGDKGDAGNPAGFGAPTASTASVSPDSPAKVKVFSSGPDTAKVFDFEFEIPQGKQGEKGDRGAAFKIDATGTLAERSQYDSQPKDFSFLATDDGNVYIKTSDSSGAWSDPIPFKGDKGDKGDKGGKGDKGDKGETGSVENLRLEITSVENGAFLVDNDNFFPVAVLTASGKCYPLEKESLHKAETGWRIDIAKYLAYDNVAEFTAPWFVYCSGGVKGEDGWSFNPDARGFASEKSNYDNEAKGFAFLAFDEGNIYFKNSDTAGDWSSAVPFRGEQGAQGLPGIPGENGLPGPMADIQIGDNGNWIVNGVDTGKKATGAGSNVIVSPTPPSTVYNGLIWVQSNNSQHLNIDPINVITSTETPSNVPDGTIWIESEV